MQLYFIRVIRALQGHNREMTRITLKDLASKYTLNSRLVIVLSIMLLWKHLCRCCSAFPCRGFTVCLCKKSLSQTPCSPFAEPMLRNSSSHEDSFVTVQITPNYHGYLLDCLVNLQLASQKPLSGQVASP